jgi:predicted nucleic acid-binding protein
LPAFSEIFVAGRLSLPESWNIHDQIIAATANFYEAILISRDEILQTSEAIEILW